MAVTEIRLIVLDWAGTTIDFGSCAPAGAFVRAFAERGVVVTLAEARAPMGLHKKDHIREMLKVADIAARWSVAVGREWIEADVEAMYQLVTPMQIAAAKACGRIIPGTLECVAKLRAMGVKIAATTGYFQTAAEVCYAAGREQGYVPDVNVCADDVSAGRPAPWMIFKAMELTDVYPPQSVVKVGDTLVDIADGRNAGVWSVGIVDSSNEMGLNEQDFVNLLEDEKVHRRATIRERYLAAGADAVIDTLAELPAYVKLLNQRSTDSL